MRWPVASTLGEFYCQIADLSVGPLISVSASVSAVTPTSSIRHASSGRSLSKRFDDNGKAPVR